jgi:hypothetical protein
MIQTTNAHRARGRVKTVHCDARAHMATRRPPNALRAVFTGFAGSILTVGAAIASIGLTTTTVSRALVMRHKKKRNMKCDACKGGKFITCRTCRGKRGLEWQPVGDASVRRVCLCPTCEGTAMQKCINCLGIGLL